MRPETDDAFQRSRSRDPDQRHQRRALFEVAGVRVDQAFRITHVPAVEAQVRVLALLARIFEKTAAALADDQPAIEPTHADKVRRLAPREVDGEIGRASCRERVCQYV